MTLEEHGFSVLKRDINPQSCRWCFTWNNYENCEDWQHQLDQLMKKIGVLYYCYGKEVAPTTGTKHLQGYFRSAKRIYKNTLTSFNIQWYVECAKGSETENIEYCSKDGDFVEVGEPIKVKGKSALMSRNQRQAQIAERKAKQKIEMTEFLEAIRNHTTDEIEAMYPREVFYHYDKILSYKIMHQKFPSTWNGNLTSKNYWVYGPSTALRINIYFQHRESTSFKSHFSDKVNLVIRLYPFFDFCSNPADIFTINMVTFFC